MEEKEEESNNNNGEEEEEEAESTKALDNSDKQGRLLLLLIPSPHLHRAACPLPPPGVPSAPYYTITAHPLFSPPCCPHTDRQHYGIYPLIGKSSLTFCVAGTDRTATLLPPSSASGRPFTSRVATTVTWPGCQTTIRAAAGSNSSVKIVCAMFLCDEERLQCRMSCCPNSDTPRP
ncbi:hypothetical protein PoB_006574200 [Plakobranchus ocellatus]|uniref:Uncharacterized protein n=1 Tax=Plakobranchus ocellatus TaxID=259542 RepID=A0AAV4D506_9GAST|nr:hypothetical protein PoB_006574200 [Plakobranchus ocellatus]